MYEPHQEQATQDRGGGPDRGALRGARCAGCGFAPASPGRIVYSDGPARVDPSEQCASCGRRLWFVIE
ncbi:MAG TPA: hypothetical protein VGP38_11220, partial [Rubrobacter sp.]|nr:hypothetical protein [Rubrobacter sp.]